MKENELNPKLPDWLRKTQNMSWEPEVFISGIVLFGLIQIPELLENFRFYFRREIYGISSDIDHIVAVLMTSVQWLIIGLILHLFIRGVWIGLVGLSYVFPKGVDNNKLNYKGKFESRIKTIPDFTNQIIQLEKVSSSIFSISYFIFMSIVGAYIFFAASLLIPFYLLISISGIGLGQVQNSPIFLNIITVYTFGILLVCGIYLIDFLSLGLLKKNKTIAKFYYPIYKIVSVLTISILYRNIYYLLISNFKKWKVMVFIAIFLMITFYMIGKNDNRSSLAKQFSQIEMYGTSSKHYLNGDSYENFKPDNRYQIASIQSDIVKGDVLRLFITHYSSFDDSVKAVCNYKMIEPKGNIDSLKLVCISQFYKVKVDDSTYMDIDWLFHYNNQSEHRGIVSYLDISHLDKGMHNVNIELEKWYYRDYDNIQFYKE